MKTKNIITAFYILLCSTLHAQSQNTISNDGTTSSFWYVGNDSTAGMGIGINQAESIPNNLTIVDKGTAGSESFTSGWQAGQGWKISFDTADGYTLSIDNLNIRGTLAASELLIEQTRVNNGDFLFSSGAKVESVRPSPPYDWFITEDITGHGLSPFQSGDLIICQVVNNAGASFNAGGDYNNNQYLIKRLIYLVTAVEGLKVYVSTVAGAPVNKGMIKKGDTFARFGSTSITARQGAVGIYTSSQHAPYLRITDEVNSWSAWKSIDAVKTQLGNLAGITDPEFGGQLQGYGLYSNNAYIKGKIIITNPEDFDVDLLWNNITNKPAFFNAPSGSGLFISATNMGYYNTTYSSQPWRTYMDNMGRFYLSGNSADYLSWDGSTLNIRGSITLSNTIPTTKITGLGPLATATNLDNVPDGASYAKILSTDIQAGHIKLSEAVGTLDDIDNGIYSKVLSTDIQSGHIKLSEALGTLDDVDNGSTYSKILSTEIDAGHIKILGSDNTTTVINGGKIQAASIKINDLSFTPATSSNIVATINASTEGLTINTNKLTLTGILQVGSAAADINSSATVINGNKIQTGTITATQIATQTITADKIVSETITGDKILAGTITANKLNITSLSALSANLGNVTAGNITGVAITGSMVQTASSGQRVVLNSSNNALEFYDGSGNAVQLNAGDGKLQVGLGLNVYGGGNISVDATGYFKGNYRTIYNNSGASITTGGLTFDGGLYISGSSTDLSSTGSYSNPSWLTTLDNSKLRNGASNNSTVTFNGVYELSSGNWYTLNYTNGVLSSYSIYGTGTTYTGTIYVSTNGTSFNKTLNVVKGIILNP